MSAVLDASRTTVAILANPRAGVGKSQRLVEGLIGALRGRGLRPWLCWDREELAERARSEGSEWRCIVSAGGDGTLLEVLNRAPGIPVALMPLGNENLVARYLRIKRCPRRVADSIAAGLVSQTDLASINERVFCVMAGVGLDAEVVHRVHARRTGHINKLSYVVPILQAMTEYRYPRIEVVVGATGERLSGAMAFVFNIPQYALGLPLAPGAQPADGLLDVYVFEKPGLLALARYVQAIVRGQQRQLPDHHHRTARQFHISATHPVPIQIDGDPAGKTPATFAVVPHGLSLVVSERG